MPSCALSRRDPPNGKNGFSKPLGFSIIELLIGVAVLAIVASLALPSYRAIIEKRKVTSAAEQAMAFLSSAQMESVKRNQIVAVNFATYTVGGTELWCLGMIAGDDESVDCDCTQANSCSVDGAERTFHSSSLGYPGWASSIDSEATEFGGEDNIVLFDPVRGLRLGLEVADLKLISPDQSMYALNIGLSPTGRVKICSDASRGSKMVPGYEEC